MGYLNFPSPTPIFPTLPPLTWSVFRKPIAASRVSIAATGREVQTAEAAYPRFSFRLSYGTQSWLRERTQNIVPFAPLNAYTELEQISGLYLQCLGPYGEFYYSDPDDNSRKNQFIAVGKGPATLGGGQFLFPVNVQWGTGPFTPPFSFPIGGFNTLDNVYINGNLWPTFFWTIDPTNTAILFTQPSAPEGTITADFSFYYRCRFLDDNLSFSEWATNLWELQQVNFETVKM